MKGLVIVTGIITLFVTLLTWARSQVLNTVLLGIFFSLAVLTLIGLVAHIKPLVKSTHYLFITSIYAGAVFATGYAMCLFAAVASLALATRLYYGTCIFHAAYNQEYQESDSGTRNVTLDAVYIVPLLVIAIRSLCQHRMLTNA